jgi:thiol-disulfide isomerase/thioredoxin
MKSRWVIAVLGVVALAAVTISTQMPWLAHDDVAMVETAARPSEAPVADAAGVACPADAKPANMDFTLKNHQGMDVALSSFKGKVLLIDFWATWCGPCKVEIPHFIEFQNQYGKDGLQIVGITIDDTADKVAPYIADMGMNYPVLLGLGRDDVQEAYGPLLGIPVTVVVSRDGKICAKHTGLTSREVFEREIKALL